MPTHSSIPLTSFGVADVDALIEFHRQRFGDARMDAGGDGGDQGEDQKSTPKTPGADGRVEEPRPQFTQADVDRIIGERLSRKDRDNEQELEELRKAKARLDELEDAQKTDEQRQRDAAQAAAEALRKAQAEATRYRAAATHGIAGDYIDLLGGGDEKTVNANAERLGELIKAKAELDALKAADDARPVDTGRPRPHLRPGATPAEHAGRASSADAAAEAAARRGRITTNNN